jgi:hypothetical protein
MKKLLTLTLTTVTLAAFSSLGVTAPKLGAPVLEQQAAPSKLDVIQEEKAIPEAEMEATSDGKGKHCRKPKHLSMTASGQAIPFPADFNPPVQPAANFGGTQIDHTLRHTFMLKPACKHPKYLSGKLTVYYKALSAGQSLTSSDAGNDTVGIYFSGGGQSEQIYSPPKQMPSIGTTGNRTLQFNSSVLGNLNNTNRVSIASQDDTSITKAVINVDYCCDENSEK